MLTATTLFQLASVSSVVGSRTAIPALLKSTSTRPYRATTAGDGARGGGVEGRPRVAEAHAEVLAADRAPGLCRCLLDHDASGRRLLGRAQRGQPAVRQPAAPLERGGGRAAQPDLQRLLHGQGREPDVMEVAGGAVVTHRL